MDKQDFERDEFGRTWLDDDSFLAPFGYYSADYKYVVDYLRQPLVQKMTLFEGFGENEAVERYVEYLKTGFGWIGFHKKKRAGFLFLELVSLYPLVYAIHGGLDLNLFGKNYGKRSMEFAQHHIFNIMNAVKVEGYLYKPNRLIKGYFTRGGLKLEGVMKNRVIIDGTLAAMQVYGLTKEEYNNEFRWKAKDTAARRPASGSRKTKKGRAGKKKRQRKSVSKR